MFPIFTTNEPIYRFLIIIQLLPTSLILAVKKKDAHLKESSKSATREQYFSEEEHSLHCAVIHRSELPADNTYVYHFSDISKHIWEFTTCVIQYLVATFFKDSDQIVVKTDNCRQQYKSLIVFGFYKEFKIKQKCSSVLWCLRKWTRIGGRNVLIWR